MWTAIASMGASFLSLISRWTGPIVGYFVGKSSAKRAQEKSEMEGIKDAAEAKRRVDTDRAFRQRLRDRFGGE